jgi:predicted negative regulator of RcsB-dependent stress response
MGDFIVLGVILVIVFLAGFKVYRDKKNGVKCSGCAQAKSCASSDCSTSRTDTKSKMILL